MPGGARRQMVVALVSCAAGAGLALLAGSQDWVSITVSRASPLPPIRLTGSGGTVEPLVPALAVVGLAGVVGLLATRRAGRLVLGGVLVLAGLAVVARSLPHLAAPSRQFALDLVEARGRAVGLGRHEPVSTGAHPLWPLLAAAGGLGLAVGGGLAAWRGRSWPGMSGRYDAPAARPGPAPAGVSTSGRSNAELWDALDDGRDPTES
ncbi:MAG TPA: TIGR02234 family membrane protein [Mycobacteriales bacterium]|nr:TIGR02234 family membrane protein [Mycobacteriales bacterium]